jgi:hypothetical protein
VAASNWSILTLLVTGQVIVWASIRTDTFSESQYKPGALKGIGFDATGATHTDPKSAACICVRMAINPERSRAVRMILVKFRL